MGRRSGLEAREEDGAATGAAKGSKAIVIGRAGHWYQAKSTGASAAAKKASEAECE